MPRKQPPVIWFLCAGPLLLGCGAPEEVPGAAFTIGEALNGFTPEGLAAPVFGFGNVLLDLDGDGVDETNVRVLFLAAADDPDLCAAVGEDFGGFFEALTGGAFPGRVVATVLSELDAPVEALPALTGAVFAGDGVELLVSSFFAVSDGAGGEVFALDVGAGTLTVEASGAGEVTAALETTLLRETVTNREIAVSLAGEFVRASECAVISRDIGFLVEPR
jgi:hypothetical protein